MTPRSVIVTGAAGYIGSHVTREFLKRGWRVTGVDNLSTGNLSALPAGVDFILADCSDPGLERVMAEGAFDAAVHLAARISVEESFADPVGYYETNLVKAGRFFASAQAAGLGALVFSSTAAVYGGEGRGRLKESDDCRPSSPYGKSKLVAEWVLRDLSEAQDMGHVILRYFNVAGADPDGMAGPREDAGHLLKVACEAAVGLRDRVIIHGDDYPTPDGTCVRDYIHVADLAEIHVAAVEHLLGGGESFTGNCGYGSGYSVREVLETAQAMAEVPFEVSVGPRRPGDHEQVVADPSLLMETLAWRPRYADLRPMLETGMAWERSRARLQGQPRAASVSGPGLRAERREA